MTEEGLSDAEARSRIFRVDRVGLLVDGTPNLADFQQRLVKTPESIETWKTEVAGNNPTLLDVVSNAKVSVLIGVSGKSGLFTERVGLAVSGFVGKGRGEGKLE